MYKDVPLRLLKKKTFAKNEAGYNIDGYDLNDYTPGVSAGSNLLHEQGDTVALKMILARGVIITHDCDIDNDDRKHITVALHRRFNASQDEQSKQTIRNNEKGAFFHTPSNGVISEGYADLRRLTTMTQTFVSHRVASMSDESVEQLRFVLIRFFTRRLLLPPEDDGRPAAATM